MHTRADIDTFVKNYLYINMHQDVEIKLKDNLKDDLGMDSLDIIEFVMELEKKYEIAIPDTDIEPWKTVNDVGNYLVERLNK